ncbi:SDR family NAD(P)-dependent oxidoreductase [Diplocloster modestus]|uniref:SDR family oxidoreductase n=1 Tax=Diplocloster modestus TaxID=2850322 RepID=A0ABS6K7J1_9FIRM|nr:SDR family oxidoreductase [Diplocloster modestus]MBU9726482.1 SDR family oxidoreductase [Diplocloster modestus]
MTIVNELFDLTGEVALVTGASKGLGKMFANTLAKAGAKVCLFSFEKDDLLRTEQEMKEAGYDCMSFLGDITHEDEVQQCVDEIIARYGKLDILVNNAGIGRCNKTPDNTSLQEWERVIDINVNGSFICAKIAGKEMLKRKKGKIINMSSISGKVINKGVHGGSYDVSKAAIDGLTKALASEWAQYNINVNAIAPGYFMTDPNKEFFKADPGFYDLAKDLIPAGHMAEPEELAGTLLYLASKASAYVHGTIIQVDGGYMVW